MQEALVRLCNHTRPHAHRLFPPGTPWRSRRNGSLCVRGQVSLVEDHRPVTDRDRKIGSSPRGHAVRSEGLGLGTEGVREGTSRPEVCPLRERSVTP